MVSGPANYWTMVSLENEIVLSAGAGYQFSPGFLDNVAQTYVGIHSRLRGVLY
jgi:hypothetical protein